MIARARRIAADRRIVALGRFLAVIDSKVTTLKLPEPCQVGPTFMSKKFPGATETWIRRGAVWFVSGLNVGFHVDFYSTGLHIEAWSGKDRRVSVWIAGEYTEATLKRDLTVSMVAAGLTDLTHTAEVRNIVTGKR